MKLKSWALLACIGAIALIVGLAFFTRVYPNLVAIDSESDITSSIRHGRVERPIPKGGGFYRVGNPYVIAGRLYIPREDPDYRAEGVASWYGEPFHGRLTANGEKYDMHALSAAHPTLPLPSYARVTNLENNLALVVRLNDRGPYHGDRLIDLSVRAAKLLGFYDRGLARVRVEYIGPAGLEGSSDKKLAATLRQVDPSDTSAAARPAAALELSDESIESVASIGAIDADLGRQVGNPPRHATNGRFPRIIFD